jgi:uncharacterized protein (TIGR03067 family)
MRLLFILLLLPTTVALAAPIPKALVKSAKEKSQLVGEWAEPTEKNRVWWFKDDGSAGGGEIGKTPRKGLYRFDASATPMTLDWSDDEGQTWQLGIFSIEGGTLKVAIGNNAKDVRPVNYDDHPRSYVISATRK